MEIDLPLAWQVVERARLNPPAITKYFYEKRRKSGESGPLPLTVEEALKIA